MDLSKAFDTMNHDLLVAKLHAYGLEKNALRLIKSYLSNRWSQIKIGSSFSTWFELLVGVPQGSILGPLFFNIFLNNLFFTVKDCDICNLADDNTLYDADIDLEKLMMRLECSAKEALDSVTGDRAPPQSIMNIGVLQAWKHALLSHTCSRWFGRVIPASRAVLQLVIATTKAKPTDTARHIFLH